MSRRRSVHHKRRAPAGRASRSSSVSGEGFPRIAKRRPTNTRWVNGLARTVAGVGNEAWSVMIWGVARNDTRCLALHWLSRTGTFRCYVWRLPAAECIRAFHPLISSDQELVFPREAWQAVAPLTMSRCEDPFLAGLTLSPPRRVLGWSVICTNRRSVCEGGAQSQHSALCALERKWRGGWPNGQLFLVEPKFPVLRTSCGLAS